MLHGLCMLFQLNKMKVNKISLLILFLLGFGIFLFTRQSNIFPFINLAIIIAPVFILRFIRSLNTKNGRFLTILGFVLSMNISLWGLFDFDDESVGFIYNIIRSFLLAILYFLPYLTDSYIYTKFRNIGVLSTLTFPISVTAIFFLFSLEGPFDGSAVYNVYAYGNIIFKQLASILGLWGFVFIFSWFASIINYAWENNFQLKRIKKIGIVYFSILLAIFLFGGIKNYSAQKSDTNTVKIATVVFIQEQENKETINFEQIFEYKLLSNFENTITRIQNSIKIAAKNNAKIISFQEYSIVVDENAESGLKTIIQNLANMNNIYISISYAVFPDEGKGNNKHLLINNNGEIIIDYTKRYLMGLESIGGEANAMNKGAEIIQTAETQYGKIAVAICKDMEFSPYIRQAGKQNVDIMIASAYSWPRSYGYDNYLRAIENGFSFINPNCNGITYAMNYNGKVLADMDYYQTKDGIMYADVPIKGINTIYSIIGDSFSWLCILLLLGSIAYSMFIVKKK